MKNILIVLFIIIFANSFVCAKNVLQSTKNNKARTITLKEYLYTPKNDSDTLTIDKSGNVVYNGKTVLTSLGVPLNSKNADSYLELKILFVAQGIKPRKDCDPSDTYKNGIYGLGCYIDVNKN